MGYGSEAVSGYLEEAWPGTEMIVQREQLGTGHAVFTAREWVSRFERVIIIPGDVPLMAKETLTRLNTRNIEADEDCTFLVSILGPDGTGVPRYGQGFQDHRRDPSTKRNAAGSTAGFMFGQGPFWSS